MTWAPTVEQFQDALRAQIGQIQFVDQAVGKIVSAAREATKDRPLIIVFTTDHGDLFGDHGLMLKHFVHYEAVTRVPLLISGPMLDIGLDDRLVSSADIAPTLLELTGCRGWRGIQGRSLVGKSKKPWRDALIVEEDQPFGLEGMSGPVRLRTLITPDYRLTAYAGQEYGELYDRSSDVEDTKNLFGTEAHKNERGEAFEKLAREMMAIADEGRKPMASA
jgi:arylsulfatase A-like enzyme